MCSADASRALQDLPPAGAWGRLRGWCRQVRAVDRFENCARVDFEPAASGAPPQSAVLLPFDRWSPLDRFSRFRRRGHRAVTHVVLRHIAEPADARIGCAALLPIEILPFQFDAALAILRGAASRVLIADSVGLGKTIQAGLIVSALRARGLAARVLILVPAGLRSQWQSELRARLGLEASIVDAAALRERTAALPPSADPWAGPGIHIFSIEFARQVDVLSSLTAPCWDVVIFDEAHHLSAHSARTAAARALAARARHVLLLTATPHDGNQRAFDALCAIGRLGPPADDPLLILRRTREVLGRAPKRRTVLHRVEETHDERRAQALLRRYVRAVNAAGTPQSRLAALVFEKRALSGPAALSATARRRLQALDEPGWWQAALPLDDDRDEAADAVIPRVLSASTGLPPAIERELLGELAEAAGRAAATASKLRRLAALLTRTREAAIVFTEYRDTLDSLAASLRGVAPIALLHGGMSPEERTAALGEFGSGAARVLLATDAAGEGLNLQATCRLVILYELPWSPARIEQRIGRVDRLGQQRRVHVWFLLGRRGEEERHAARLSRRLRQLHEAFGDTLRDLAPELDECRTVSSLKVPHDTRACEARPLPATDLTGLTSFERSDRGDQRSGEEDAGEAGARTLVTEVSGEATKEARALMFLRGLRDRVLAGRAGSAAGREPRFIPWARLRPRHRALAPGVIYLLLTPEAPGAGDRLIALHVAFRVRPPLPARALVEALQPQVLQAAAQLPSTDDRLRQRLAAREEALARRINEPRRAWQPGLFDRRAARAVAAAADRLEAQRREHQLRLASLRRHALRPPRVVAALLLE